MTDTTDDSPPSATPYIAGSQSGPGRTIRMAREAASLTIDELANQTRLTRATLEALERDDFETLSEPVYIRGYYRKCAKSLVLSEAELIAAYERIAAPKAPLAPTKLLLTTAGQEDHHRRPLLTWLIVLGLALLLGVGLFVSRRGEFLRGSVPAESSPVEAGESGNKSAVPIAPAAGAEGAAAVPVEAKPLEPRTPAEPEPKVEAKPESKSELKLESKLESKPELKPESTSVEAKPAEVAVPSPTPSSAGVPGVVAGTALSLQFRGKSWVRVEDASGKMLMSRMAEGGASETVIGRPPYSILLGNAPVVDIQFGGQPIKIEPYIRGDSATARFQVPPAPVQ